MYTGSWATTHRDEAGTIADAEPRLTCAEIGASRSHKLARPLVSGRGPNTHNQPAGLCVVRIAPPR